jgi:predicted metal-dependent hydrolase
LIGSGGSLLTLWVGSTAIPYRLRRSARARRLRLTVQADGVEVVAPLRIREPEIVRFVEQHGHWVLDRVSRLRRTLAAHPGRSGLADGGRIPYRGDPVELRIAPAAGPRAIVRYRDGFEVALPERIPDEDRDRRVEAALTSWLRRQARLDAERLIERHGPPHRLLPKGLRIKDQKRIWGSCSARGLINLNWRLILAPAPVFEYVVVHELCHLRVRNHQREFWRLVGEVLPGFEPQRRWLRANGHLLTLRPARLG